MEVYTLIISMSGERAEILSVYTSANLLVGYKLWFVEHLRLRGKCVLSFSSYTMQASPCSHVLKELFGNIY